MNAPSCCRALILASAALLGGCEMVTNIDDLEAEPKGFATAGAHTSQAGMPSVPASGGSSPAAGGAAATAGATSSSGAGSAGAGQCQGYCDRVLAPACSGVTDGPACLSGCQETLATPGCANQASAVVSCVAERGATSCSSGDVSIAGCNGEISALLACSACLPAKGDTACTTCTKTACCAQLKAFSGDPQASAYLNCTDPCTTAVCYDACASIYPSAGDRFTAVIACLQQSCSGACQ